MIAVAPASAACSRPSGKGKKASEAQAEPCATEARQAERFSRFLGADRGDAGAVLAVHLACADAGGLAVLGVDHGVRFHMLGDGEGKQHVANFVLASAHAW